MMSPHPAPHTELHASTAALYIIQIVSRSSIHNYTTDDDDAAASTPARQWAIMLPVCDAVIVAFRLALCTPPLRRPKATVMASSNESGKEAAVKK